MTIKEPLEESLNKKYGNLTVIEFTGTNNKHGEKFVKCICDCGIYKICLLRLLRRGTTKSCGCIKKISSKQNIKKGHQFLIDTEKWKDPLLRTQQYIYKKYSDGDLTFDEFLLLSKMNCFYCDRQPSNKCSVYSACGAISKDRLENSYYIYNGLDRVDNTLSHTKNNVVPCCKQCNTAKSDYTQKDFFKWISLVYSKHIKI